jgi:hypothetical protein
MICHYIQLDGFLSHNVVVYGGCWFTVLPEIFQESESVEELVLAEKKDPYEG